MFLDKLSGSYGDRTRQDFPELAVVIDTTLVNLRECCGMIRVRDVTSLPGDTGTVIADVIAIQNATELLASTAKIIWAEIPNTVPKGQALSLT